MHQEIKLPTFADVAGIVQAKAEMQSVVELLRDPRKYRIVGARQPRGILLVRVLRLVKLHNGSVVLYTLGERGR